MRTSRSARQSFDAEMTRLRGMSIEERVLEALGMAERYSWLERKPDGQDPLGGVIDVTGPFGALKIISFAGRFPIVIEDALRTTTMMLRPGSPLKSQNAPPNVRNVAFTPA